MTLTGDLFSLELARQWVLNAELAIITPPPNPTPRIKNVVPTPAKKMRALDAIIMSP